jgi:hypothetical protein
MTTVMGFDSSNHHIEDQRKSYGDPRVRKAAGDSDNRSVEGPRFLKDQTTPKIFHSMGKWNTEVSNIIRK